MSTRLNKTQAEWVAVVNDMVSRGAQGSQNDLDNVVAYLASNFGKDKPASQNAALAQTATPTPTVEKKFESPLSVSEVSKAKELIKNGSCLTCHRYESEGSYQGPRLDGIGTRRTAEQIRTSIIKPNAVVLPENRSVHLVTHDGKTVTGKILNQDGFSVELIDSSSRLVTYQKSSLREFSILDTNPMPSYENKMSAEDLSDLVRYLSSLKETGK
jgi:putative heme-binding domain-containing protein